MSDRPDSQPETPQFQDPQSQGHSFLEETLFAPSGIRMFGRKFVGVTLGQLGINPTSNAPLLTMLRNLPAGAAPQLARIYGFSHHGNYYKLDEPVVFLVYNDGIPVVPGQTPIPLEILGVEFKDEVFAEQVRMWFADQLDIGVRIGTGTGITVGWMQDILLGSTSNITGGVPARLPGKPIFNHVSPPPPP